MRNCRKLVVSRARRVGQARDCGRSKCANWAAFPYSCATRAQPDQFDLGADEQIVHKAPGQMASRPTKHKSKSGLSRALGARKPCGHLCERDEFGQIRAVKVFASQPVGRPVDERGKCKLIELSDALGGRASAFAFNWKRPSERKRVERDKSFERNEANERINQSAKSWPNAFAAAEGGEEKRREEKRREFFLLARSLALRRSIPVQPKMRVLASCALMITRERREKAPGANQCRRRETRAAERAIRARRRRAKSEERPRS